MTDRAREIVQDTLEAAGIDCTRCSMANYNRDCANNKIYDVNLDWQEEWTSQADDAVSAGIALRRAKIGGASFDEALVKANALCLTTAERDDMGRCRAGVL